MCTVRRYPSVDGEAPPLPDEMPEIWGNEVGAPPLPEGMPGDNDNEDDLLPSVPAKEEAPAGVAPDVDEGQGGGGKLTRHAAIAGRGSTPNERNIFALLRDHLKKRRKHAKDLYRTHCSSTDGKMDGGMLATLVQELLPDVTPRELRHFMVMVDTDGDGRLTAKEFEDALKTSRAVHGAVRAEQEGAAGGKDGNGGSGGGDAAAGTASTAWGELALRLRAHLTSEASTAENVFTAADKDGSGYLEPAELAQVVKAMLPDVGAAELKHMLTHMVFMDPDGDGRLSLKELKQAVA